MMTTQSSPAAGRPGGLRPFGRLLTALLATCCLALAVPSAVTPASAQVPTPASVIGFEPGTDYKLADYSEMLAYYEALDAASDRVILERIGESTEGRPMVLALISSPENLANRERYKEIARRLALVKGVDEAEARRLAAEGKAIVWIDAGLHATEVAHAQHAPLFAHWLATDEGEEARRIREDAIVLLMPVMNPDGLDIVVDWYERVLGTPFETAGLPVLYQKYIGHDNNRDWNLFTQAETRAIARQLYHEWFPQIVYNHHQSSPFPGRIWMPPVADPINPNLDPLVVSSLNRIGESMKARFSEEGKPGAVSGIVFDGWGSMYMSDAPNYHNMLGLITETALYRYATPHCYEEDEIPETFGGGLPAKDPTTSYPDPWLGGCWHLGDAVDYMMTASREVADIGAREAEQWLFNIWRTGRRQIEKAERAEGGPFAWVIDPSDQHDPGAVTRMLRSMRHGGIEVVRAEGRFEAGGTRYPEGTYVIPPQAFRPFAVDLLDPKEYPDRRLYPDGPPEPPYDMTGYELPMMFGLEVDRVTEPFEMPGEPIDEIPVPAGGVEGRGDWGFALSWAPNASVRAANRLLAAGAEVSRATSSFEAGEDWPAGTIVARGVDREAVDALGRELGLTFRALRREPSASLAAMRAPRIGLYQSHVASMPEGWTRWVLEQHGFEYRTLHDDDIRTGDLSALDVIILPNQNSEDLLLGHLVGTMPEEYTGGLGLEGAFALEEFVRDGGWMVAVDRAVDFPIDLFGLPVRNVTGGRSNEDFFIPGSLIRMTADVSDPLAYGVATEPIALFVRSQVLDVIPGAEEGDIKIERDVDTYVHFAEEDALASGWALGLGTLEGRPAAMRVPLGRGQVVLLGIDPHFRASPQGTFKLLFNPLFAAATEGAALVGDR